jgi:Zn-dependent protease with chaperone function
MRAAELYYVRTLEQAAARKALDVDRTRLVEMRFITQSLIEPARAQRPEASDWSWSIHLETRAEPIALFLPGGKILVSTGLFDRYALTMPEFAALLAHQVAHALAGEDTREILREFSRSGETVSPDPNRTALRLADVLARIVASTRHDETSERAADVLALQLMANAGVDPRAALDAWRKVAGAAGESPPAFSALHPAGANRIAELETSVPAMVALYEQTLREQPTEPPKKQRPSRTTRRPSSR